MLFIAVLSSLVIAAASSILVYQHQYLIDNEQDRLRIRMALIGEIATEALLRSDYDAVQSLIQHWVKLHPHIHEIQAILPNGFVLAQARKGQPAEQPVHVTQPVYSGDKLLLTLNSTSNYSVFAAHFTAIVIKVTSLALVFIILLGWLLWTTLKRTALLPLQEQILSGEEKEQALLQRTAELEAYSYSVSHDLRAPLRSIDGFSRILLEDHSAQLNSIGQSHLLRVIANVTRMGELIDDMMALSRVSRHALVIIDVDLSLLAQQIMTELQEQSPPRQASIKISPGLQARGDAQLLRILLTNLLGNAWKYSANKPSTHIEFRCSQEPDEAPGFCICDQGDGFDMQYVNNLFQPFQRLHTGGEFPGNGIGLATAARIIQRHKGQISATAQPGVGATFCFNLNAD